MVHNTSPSTVDTSTGCLRAARGDPWGAWPCSPAWEEECGQQVARAQAASAVVPYSGPSSLLSRQSLGWGRRSLSTADIADYKILDCRSFLGIVKC